MVNPLLFIRIIAALSIAAGINFFAASIWAQNATEEHPPRDVGGTLDRLSRQTYSDRHTATIEMWKDRDHSRAAVQEAARDSDPEVAGRARWILRQWRRGAMPDTPPEISRLLQAGDQPAAIERLIEAGQFSAAVVAVEESAGTIDRESIQRRINAALLRRFPIYVHTAMRSESLGDLLDLIDLVADSNETAACRFELMRLLEMPIADDKILPKSAASWSPLQRDTSTAILLAKSGRFDEAIEVARTSGNEQLWLNCLMMNSRWRTIADDRHDLAKRSDVGSIEHCLHWCQTMMAADRCGDTGLYNEAVKQLTAPEICKLEVASEYRWKYLANHGQVDAALDVLGPMNADAAASVALDSSRTRRAFEVLGFPIDRIDSDYLIWIDEAVAAQRNGPHLDLAPQIQTLLVLMQCLLSTGRDDVAWTIARRLCESDLRIDGNRKIRVAEYVLSTLAMTKRADWITRLSIDPADRSVTPDTLEIVGRVLPDADATTIDIVMDALSKMNPGHSPEQLFLSASRLISGEIPSDFNPDVDFARFFEVVTRPRAARSVRASDNQNVAIQANLNIVSMLSRLGQTKLAASCLSKLAQSGDTDAVFRMAEQSLDSGRADTASQLFELVYRTIELQGRFGGADDVALAGKSLIGLWTISRRSGDRERSDELMREIRFVLCTPSLQTRGELAEYLADREETALSIEAYQSLLPIKALSSNEADDLYSVARDYALTARDSAPADAAHWFDLAVIRSVESDDFRPSAFVTLPMYVGRWRLEDAIAKSDSIAARRHTERLLKLDPLDIDLAERLLPKMRDASMADLADQTFASVFDEGLRYTETFSLDAMVCNNLAWVAAMNATRLDEARRLSESAVQLEPDSAIYRDTLAEILFLSGDKPVALKIEQDCLLDDPGQWHLHEQIKRFSK